MKQLIKNNTAQQKTMLMELSKYLDRVELRIISKTAGVKSKLVVLDEQGIPQGLEWIKEYPNETIYTTFNVMNSEIETVKALKDTDIKEYAFIFIDIDSEHPTDSSAKDSEVEEAKKVADNVKGFFTNNEFTDPIYSHSGNGYHLLYPIELTEVSKAKDVIKLLLKLLSEKFSNVHAKIDTVVSNPSRITKLTGTVSKKGESTEERPHRTSRLIEAPDEVNRTEFSKVKALVSKLQQQINKSSTIKKVGLPVIYEEPVPSYIVVDKPDEWLKNHPIFKVQNTKEEEGRIVYPLSDCPLREHHQNSSGSAFIWNKKTHQLVFNCLHESCKNRTMLDVLKKYDIVIPKQQVSENSFDQEDYMSYGNYQLRKEGVSYRDPKKGMCWICSPIMIKSIYRNLHTKEVSYAMKFQSNGEWIEGTFPASILNLRNIGELVNYGFDYQSRSEDKVISYLQLQKRNAKIKNVHTRVGWHDEVFYLNQSYPLDSVQNRGSSKYLSEADEYRLQGSFEAWKTVIEQDVLGTNLELGLALSFTSNIVGYLKMKGLATIDCPVISFSGRSSSGKTTMEYLIAGVYGQPNELVEMLNMTDNALIQSLASNHGVPLIFDELGVVSDKDLSALIYQISTGKGRKRLNSNADLVAASQFSTTAIFSSEQPLSNYLNSSLGLRARVIAFDGISWTKSASASQNVKAASQLNSGQAIDQFMKKMVSDAQVDILSMIKRNEEKLKLQMMHHAIKERVCQQLALILTSGELVKRYLDISIDVTNLIELLLQSYAYAIDDASESSEEEIASRLSSLLVANRHKFGYQKYTESWGIIQEKLDSSQYVVNKSVFLKLFSRNFEKVNLKQQLNYMKTKGLLLTEKDRLTKRMTVNNQNITCYVFKLPKVTHDVIEQFEPQVVHPKPITFRDSDKLFKSIDQSNELTDADFNDTETGGEK